MKFFKRLRSSSFGSVSLRILSSSRSGVIPEGTSPSTAVNFRPNDVPVLPLTELGRGDSSTNIAIISSQRNQPVPNPIIVADLGFPPNPFEPPQEVAAQLNFDSSLGEELELEPVIANSKYESSPFIPFDHREIQSRESPDNLVSKPRYNNMIFFDPKENNGLSSDPKDQRRKKFLTVISSANSISPHASPSNSPRKQTDISATVIQNTYQQSLKKMKDILLEIEKYGYKKNEIIEAYQYARQFKGIMKGRDGVIRELKRKNSELFIDEIEAKFERLKEISFRFQQECFKKEIYSGRDENSLKSQYKFADGKNKRPGLRLAYIPDEAFEMYKRHNEAAAVIFSARPDAARMSP